MIIDQLVSNEIEIGVSCVYIYLSGNLMTPIYFSKETYLRR